MKTELSRRTLLQIPLLLIMSVLRGLSSAIQFLHCRTYSLFVSTALLGAHTQIYCAHCYLFAVLTTHNPRKQ